MKILDIFADKLDLDPVENREFKTWITDLDRDKKTLNNISTVTGGGAGINHGNVEISFADGITLKNPSSGARTVYLDPDGDAWFGSDIDSVAQTTMFIVSNDQRYNSETFGKGDLLLGDNSTGKANLFWDASTGKLFIRSGQTASVEIGDGGIIIDWATIGGWSIDATRIYNADMEFNSSTSKITAGTIELDGGNEILSIGTGLVFVGADETLSVGEGQQKILIDGANGLIKSNTYSEDSAGWQIHEDGKAEFASVRVRGAIQSSVFEYDSISAVGGGRFLIGKDASEVWAGFSVSNSVGGGGSFYAWGRNRDTTAFAATDDIVVAKYWDGTQVVTFEGRITTVGNDLGGYRLYGYVYIDGDLLENIGTGAAVVNYGPSGFGVLDLQGGATPRMVVSTHAGDPLNTVTDKAVLGNMKNKFGTGANDRYGIGLGDYSGGNYMSYNAEAAGKFIVRAGDGVVTIAEGGIVIDDSDVSTREVQWRYDTDGANDYIGGIYGDYGGSGDAITRVRAYRQTGDPWGAAGVILSASDSINSKYPYLWLTTDGSNEGYLQLWNSRFFQQKDGALIVGDFSPSYVDGGIYSKGVAIFGDGSGYNAFGVKSAAGSAGDMIWWSGANIAAIWRRNSNHDIEWVRYNPAGTSAGVSMTWDSSTGDVYSTPFTYYDPSPTIVGWSSLTVKVIYYKLFGKTCHVWFALQGTSNATNAYFYMPFNVQPASGQSFQVPIYAVNNGSVQTAMGRLDIPSSGNQFMMYKTMPAAGWTASGTKGMRGHFTFQIA